MHAVKPNKPYRLLTVRFAIIDDGTFTSGEVADAISAGLDSLMEYEGGVIADWEYCGANSIDDGPHRVATNEPVEGEIFYFYPSTGEAER